jgi:hypothetical protein
MLERVEHEVALARQEALERLTLAKSELERRLEGMNAVRDQLRDQASTFVTKPEMVALHAPVVGDVRWLREQVSTFITKPEMEVIMSPVAGDVRWLREQMATAVHKVEFESITAPMLVDIRVLRESKALLEGKASQGSVNLATWLAIAGLLVGVAGLFLHFVK